MNSSKGARPKFSTDSRRSSSAVQSATCVAAVGILALAAHFSGLTFCPLKRLLGIPCPTCGTTRAFVLLLGGEPREAFATQPFALVALPLLLLCVMVPRIRTSVSALWRRTSVKILALVLLLADWIYVLQRGN